MPLQNRVDPFGELHAVATRGLFTGNRGVLHDPAAKILRGRRWTTKAWIVCDLVHPKGVRREAMGRNTPSGGAGWTELFFLDEVTALAAGHRPCFYCRRDAAQAFAACFARGQGRDSMTAPEMDAILHAERLAAGEQPSPLTAAAVHALPDGAVVAFGARCYALHGGRLLPWRFEGYGEPSPPCRAMPAEARLITPPATVAALRAGYRPAWHATAANNS